MAAYWENPRPHGRTDYTVADVTYTTAWRRDTWSEPIRFYYDECVSNFDWGIEPPKNWRWFHIFTDWLINRAEALREQVRLPLAPHRYQAKVNQTQQRRHKRKRYLIELRAA